MLANLSLDNSALLVIDVINSCAHADFEDPARNIHYNKIRQMVPALSRFILVYQNLGGQVILTTTVPWQEPYLPENINELYRENAMARYWSHDNSGRAEHFFQIPTEGALVFAKNSYDAFTNEERQSLQQYLKRRVWPLMYGATVESKEILAMLSQKMTGLA